jgi:hypothetical protein
MIEKVKVEALVAEKPTGDTLRGKVATEGGDAVSERRCLAWRRTQLAAMAWRRTQAEDA